MTIPTTPPESPERTKHPRASWNCGRERPPVRPTSGDRTRPQWIAFDMREAIANLERILRQINGAVLICENVPSTELTMSGEDAFALETVLNGSVRELEPIIQALENAAERTETYDEDCCHTLRLRRNPAAFDWEPDQLTALAAIADALCFYHTTTIESAGRLMRDYVKACPQDRLVIEKAAREAVARLPERYAASDKELKASTSRSPKKAIVKRTQGEVKS